ncbi:hypothetical protein POVWA2_018120 [Plasmodium ovale wallikeri]|uniref:Uncharacterized protein n=1 Tax=Plasmodium ovale wallikeri TaxID=864142 RepID=A0A1A8YR39_PLAOA|nr:hypothetical protein POVWA2_018120 [Plasmodium ovale wallikeri]
MFGRWVMASLCCNCMEIVSIGVGGGGVMLFSSGQKLGEGEKNNAKKKKKKKKKEKMQPVRYLSRNLLNLRELQIREE